jgi:hypothetical protein
MLKAWVECMLNCKQDVLYGSGSIPDLNAAEGLEKGDAVSDSSEDLKSTASFTRMSRGVQQSARLRMRDHTAGSSQWRLRSNEGVDLARIYGPACCEVSPTNSTAPGRAKDRRQAAYPILSNPPCTANGCTSANANANADASAMPMPDTLDALAPRRIWIWRAARAALVAAWQTTQLPRGRRCRPVWHRNMSSDESRRVTMEHATQPVAVRGDNTTTRGRAAKSHRAGCAHRGAKKDTARQYSAFTARRNIRPHAHGVRLSRALSSALSLDAPNAQWPAASLVLAPILNLQGRSR